MRNRNLDLIKWLAMLTMVIDHLRYVIHGFDSYFLALGRFAFPFFCLAMAVNLHRAKEPSFFSTRNQTYIKNLAVFAVISELPYRLLDAKAIVLNVIPTLLLGLLVAGLAASASGKNKVMAVMVFVAACLLNKYLMYGVAGVMLPLAFLIAIKNSRSAFYCLLPMAVSFIATGQYYAPLLDVWSLLGYSRNFLAANCSVLLVLVMAGVTPLLGLKMLSMRIQRDIWPVRKWGYWFYPVQFILFYLITLS